MEIIRGMHNLRSMHRGCVVTMGNFDGVHHGHQMVIAHLNAKRDELGVPSTLITFEPLPREFFQGTSKPGRLTRFREKMLLLRRAGLDRVLLLPFNERTAKIEAREVIEDFFVRGLDVRYVVMGDDSHFGRDRVGDYNMLCEAGAQFGFGVSHMGTLMSGKERISSSLIRAALAEGDFPTAEKLLGRRYFIMGRVGYGRQLGRQLGVPTANIRLRRYRAALAGVFAVEVELDRENYIGVANIGVRPTVGGKEPLLEVHVFDYAGDAYGKHMTVTFRHKIRPEQTFPSLDALKVQIANDSAQAHEWFNHHGVESDAGLAVTSGGALR